MKDAQRTKRCAESKENNVKKWNYQKRENLKTNQIEILKLKSTLTEILKFTGQIQRLIWAGRRKKSVNLQIGQWKLLSLRNRKKKEGRKDSLSDLWDTSQSTYTLWETQKEKKEEEEIFEEMMADNFQIR